MMFKNVVHICRLLFERPQLVETEFSSDQTDKNLLVVYELKTKMDLCSLKTTLMFCNVKLIKV